MTTAANFLVGQLTGRRGEFAAVHGSGFSGGRISLAPIQPVVGVYRGSERVGRTIAGEVNYDGVWLIAEMRGGFKPDNTSRWLHPHFDTKRAARTRGSRVDFDDVILTSVTLEALPSAFNAGEVEYNLCDPRLARGGHSWGVSETNRQVMNRCADHDEHIGRRRSDEFNLCSLLHPDSHHTHRRTAPQPAKALPRSPSPAAVGSTRPSSKAMRRMLDAGIDPSWTDEHGQTHHVRIGIGRLELR